MFEKFKKKFTDNFAVKDIPKAIIFYKVTGYGVYLAGLGICYRYRPLRKLCRVKCIGAGQNYLVRTFPRINGYVVGNCEKLAKNKYFKSVTNKFGMKSQRTTTALIEVFVLYKLLFPLIIYYQFQAMIYLWGKQFADVSLEQIADETLTEFPIIHHFNIEDNELVEDDTDESL
jgi:hypothetical protein